MHDAVTTLRPDEFASEEFRHLLWLACEQPDDRLDHLAAEVLPRREVLGVRQRGTPVAFAACRVVEPTSGAPDEPFVELEYLATDEAHRGRGLGTCLVDAARRLHPRLALRLGTDDDAIAFYRRLGFQVEVAPPDPRWPERRRYACQLPPLA